MRPKSSDQARGPLLWSNAARWLAVLMLLTGAQAQSNAAKPRVAGLAVASEFGQWSAEAEGPVQGTGRPEGITIEGAAAVFTLPDGTSFMPFAVGAPVRLSDAGNSETVTPLAVNCPGGGQTCSITADFTQPHPGRFTIRSGTDGLQEAINYTAAHGGGTVLADANWQGSMAALLPALQLPANVLLIDSTAGNWNFYGLGNGGEPQLIGGFSSATGSSITAPTNLTPAKLNGAVFVHAANFSSVSPGSALSANVPATVTPAWSLPEGVIAGDRLYITGGIGTAEVVTASNIGTACPGGSAVSICFTPANSHSGAWSLASATAGLQEAVNRAGAGGWVIDDEPVATIHAPVELAATVRITGFSNQDNATGTQVVQATANTDVFQIGTPTTLVQDAVIEHLMAVGVSGGGSDSGVAFHCVNCAKLKLTDVTGTNAHDGVYFDSANGHAYDGDVLDSHFIGNENGVHIAGGSANRLTFVGDTVDGNSYGVFDDGGWVHTWIGDDIESNSQYGYWQQVSQPGAYSGHNIVLHSNYFEANGSNVSGQGDVFLGQLVGGGSGNNGAGCINCEVTDNIFNASLGGNVTALSLGAVQGTVEDNTYSGYGANKIYSYITGPNPNFTKVLSLGDGGSISSATNPGQNYGAYGGAWPGTITRIDSNGALVLGGTDQLTDQHGTLLNDTTVESPTGVVRLRGKPGGSAAANPAEFWLDGNSTSMRSDEIKWRNADTDEWGIKNDASGAGAHDFCLANDYANPAAATCDLYLNQQKHFQFSASGVPGNITFDADYRFKQQANGDPGVQIMRFTDTAPTGYLLDLEDSTESHPLFRVDASGNVTGSGTINIAGAATFQSTLAMGAGSTVGGLAINTSAPRVSGQSGTILGGTYAAGSCQSGGISFASGVAIGMAVASNPESVPPAGLVWNAYIDAADHVTIRVCNATSGSITWSSGAVWDVRVLP